MAHEFFSQTFSPKPFCRPSAREKGSMRVARRGISPFLHAAGGGVSKQADARHAPVVRRLPASVVQAPASERACLPTSKLSVLSPHRTPSGRSGFVHDNPDSKRATREIVMALQRLRNEMQGLRYILFDETNYKNTDLSRFGPVYPKLVATRPRAASTRVLG